MITGYQGKGGDEVIPSTIYGVLVQYIGYGAFANQTTIISIVVPDSVKGFGMNEPPEGQPLDLGVFEGCAKLRSVTLPQGFNLPYQNMFKNCSKLENVVIPKTTFIPDYCFKGCTSLKSVTIPKTIVNFRWKAFEGCTGLEEVIFEDTSATYNLGGYTFKDCVQLKKIQLPKTECIGSGLFQNCYNLSELTFRRVSKKFRPMHLRIPLLPLLLYRIV